MASPKLLDEYWWLLFLAFEVSKNEDFGKQKTKKKKTKRSRERQYLSLIYTTFFVVLAFTRQAFPSPKLTVVA